MAILKTKYSIKQLLRLGIFLQLFLFSVFNTINTTTDQFPPFIFCYLNEKLL